MAAIHHGNLIMSAATAQRPCETCSVYFITPFKWALTVNIKPKWWPESAMQRAVSNLDADEHVCVHRVPHTSRRDFLFIRADSVIPPVLVTLSKTLSALTFWCCKAFTKRIHRAVTAHRNNLDSTVSFVHWNTLSLQYTVWVRALFHRH